MHWTLYAPKASTKSDSMQHLSRTKTAPQWLMLAPLQLTERRQGNQRYQCKDFEAARKHYEGAKSIVDMIQGSGATEQQEIDNNRVTILLNLAALHLATKENRKAVQCCSEALQLEPNSKKALLRRGKANMRMHNYKVGFLLDQSLCAAMHIMRLLTIEKGLENLTFHYTSAPTCLLLRFSASCLEKLSTLGGLSVKPPNVCAGSPCGHGKSEGE